MIAMQSSPSSPATGLSDISTETNVPSGRSIASSVVVGPDGADRRRSAASMALRYRTRSIGAIIGSADWPPIASALRPNISSAAAFVDHTTPSRSSVITPSPADSTIARVRWVLRSSADIVSRNGVTMR